MNIIHNTGKVPLIVTFGGLTIVIRPGAIWEPTHEYEYLGTLDIKADTEEKDVLPK